MNSAQNTIKILLDSAGIGLNGSAPGDITVKDERLYRRVLSGGSLALGEAYLDGWWEAEPLDVFFAKILRARLDKKFVLTPAFIAQGLWSRLLNLQSGQRAFRIGEAHYDKGNDLYQSMLDKRMAYTCGYWSGYPAAANLDAAQEAKLDLVCRKIGLRPGMRVLDIGCGWGSFMKFAAEKYGVNCVGVTVSKEQIEFGKELCAGLPVEFRLADYRTLNEKFDRVVSLGMFEHVGHKNYRTYFKVANRCLKDDGLFLLHTIGIDWSSTTTDPFIAKYIFPNSLIPSLKQVAVAVEKLFVMEDWHNFGVDYDKTLLAWFNNFDAHWPELKEKYGDRFYRIWKYYLLSCAGAFRARYVQLWQIVFSKHGLEGGYRSIR